MLSQNDHYPTLNKKSFSEIKSEVHAEAVIWPLYDEVVFQLMICFISCSHFQILFRLGAYWELNYYVYKCSSIALILTLTANKMPTSDK